MGKGSDRFGDRRFRDRRHAGRGLGDELRRLGLRRPHVLALPRGGVPVAVEVASALEAPMDVLVARKVALRSNPEYAIGAVAEGVSDPVLRSVVVDLELSEDEVARAVDDAWSEVRRRADRYRDGRGPPDLGGEVAVIVDDGLATGATADAAIRAARALGADDVVLAVPVGSADTAKRLGAVARVVCLSTPERFTAVGLWYDDFDQVTDSEVLAALAARG